MYNNIKNRSVNNIYHYNINDNNKILFQKEKKTIIILYLNLY